MSQMAEVYAAISDIIEDEVGLPIELFTKDTGVVLSGDRCVEMLLSVFYAGMRYEQIRSRQGLLAIIQREEQALQN